MKKKNTIEDELDAIRVSLYEETKNMSPSELTAYIKAQTEPMLKEHGITPVRGVQTQTSGDDRAVV